MLFFLVFVERPTEAPAKALEKKRFEGGVAMECWKKLLNEIVNQKWFLYFKVVELEIAMRFLK